MSALFFLFHRQYFLTPQPQLLQDVVCSSQTTSLGTSAITPIAPEAATTLVTPIAPEAATTLVTPIAPEAATNTPIAQEAATTLVIGVEATLLPSENPSGSTMHVLGCGDFVSVTGLVADAHHNGKFAMVEAAATTAGIPVTTR